MASIMNTMNIMFIGQSLVTQDPMALEFNATYIFPNPKASPLETQTREVTKLAWETSTALLKGKACILLATQGTFYPVSVAVL